MYCPYCTESDTKVLESRVIDSTVRRRRECLQCENRFTTYEQAVFHFSVLKKDGREEPFKVEKIRNSVLKALAREEDGEVQALTARIEQLILSKKKNPIKTLEIGRMVLHELRKADKMAYLRFASIHKSIEDPQQLRKELQLIA